MKASMAPERKSLRGDHCREGLAAHGTVEAELVGAGGKEGAMITGREAEASLSVGAAERDELAKRLDAALLVAAGDGGAKDASRLRGLGRVEGGGGEHGLSSEHTAAVAKALVTRDALGAGDGVTNALGPGVGRLARCRERSRR